MIVAGVDGCRGGWLAAIRRADGTGPATARVAAAFADRADGAAIVAVDMPIGLPERVAGGGRGPEQAARRLPGARRSSVFAIPGRAAVHAVEPHPEGFAARIEAHRRASAVALELSEPPRKVSSQVFRLFPRSRELDRWRREDPARAARVREVHPEAAFWRMNGERPPASPKKVRGRPHAEGLAERRPLLLGEGLPPEAVAAPPPPGAGADDLLDALACRAAAARLAAGRGRPRPDPPSRDRFGFPVAIRTWA